MKKIFILLFAVAFSFGCSDGSTGSVTESGSSGKDVCSSSEPCADKSQPAETPVQEKTGVEEEAKPETAGESQAESAEYSRKNNTRDAPGPVSYGKDSVENTSVSVPGKKKTKVVFLIADGAGPSIFNLLIEYARYSKKSPYGGKPSNLEKMMNAGRIAYVINGTAKTLVTDSAAAATQLATGKLTNPGNLGVDDKFFKAENLAELSKKKGLATGVVTNTHITDATPGAFAAHVNNRNKHEFIALSYLDADLDVVLGGGAKYFINSSAFRLENGLRRQIPYASKIDKEGGKLNILPEIRKKGYDVVFDRQNLKNYSGRKLFGLFASHGMAYEIARPEHEPSLSEMSSKALEVLSKNEKGFFLMIESGLIDWVAHPNETGAVMKELLEFDRLLGVLISYINRNPETLLVITADHDTGGVGFEYAHLDAADYERRKAAGYELFSKTDGYSNGEYVAGVTDHMDYAAKENLDILAGQKKTYVDMFREIKELSETERTPQKISEIFYEGTGLRLPPEKFTPDMGVEQLSRVFNKETGMFWGSHNHTGAPLLTVYYGNQGSLRGGVLQNTELHDTIEEFIKAD